MTVIHCTTTTTILRPFFRDRSGEPVPEENFLTLWCKGRLKEADTLTIGWGDTPSGLTSVHLHHPPYFLRAGCPSSHRTNSIKALKAIAQFCGYYTTSKINFLHLLQSTASSLHNAGGRLPLNQTHGYLPNGTPSMPFG